MHPAIAGLLLVASSTAWAAERCDATSISIELGRHDAAAGWVEENAVLRVQCTNDAALPVQGHVVVEIAAPEGDAWKMHNARGDIKLLFGTREEKGYFVPQRRYCIPAELAPGRASVVPVPMSMRMRLPGDLSGVFRALYGYHVTFRRERPDDCP